MIDDMITMAAETGGGGAGAPTEGNPNPQPEPDGETDPKGKEPDKEADTKAQQAAMAAVLKGLPEQIQKQVQETIDKGRAEEADKADKAKAEAEEKAKLEGMKEADRDKYLADKKTTGLEEKLAKLEATVAEQRAANDFMQVKTEMIGKYQDNPGYSVLKDEIAQAKDVAALDLLSKVLDKMTTTSENGSGTPSLAAKLTGGEPLSTAAIPDADRQAFNELVAGHNF